MTESALPLQIRDLSFRYNTRSAPALSHVNLSLHRGEVLLLAGSSGCGKSTLMRCINGLIPYTYRGEQSGEILLFGQNTAGLSLSQISKHVGTILQDPERQILGSYVINEVCFGLESLGWSYADMQKRADEVLERLHIAHLRDKETFLISGGEKQKVALAGVLAMQPDILLLDEPLASLDPASAQEVLQALRGLADQGLAIMIVEHRVEDVLSIRPDHVLYMEDGQVQFSGEVPGLMDAVDYRRIKLPAQDVIRRSKGQVVPEFMPAVPAVDPTAAPLVSFKDVHFRYKEDGPEVLHGLNLDVRAGEVVAILGHNGSGKTTTVKHCIGLLKPTSGQLLLQGQDTRKMSIAQAAKTVGYVFQSPTQMLFAPTVRDELAYGPKNLGFPAPQIEESVNWAIETVHLQEELPTPPLALSFGQQKRVSIASVLSMRSRVLMMDEPTAGQDYWNYNAFMQTILQTPGFDAILFITHDLDLALIYANRVVVMFGGQIVADGSPQEVLSDEDNLRKWRLVPTSLMRVNRDLYPQTGKFLPAEALASYVS